MSDTSHLERSAQELIAQNQEMRSLRADHEKRQDLAITIGRSYFPSAMSFAMVCTPEQLGAIIATVPAHSGTEATRTSLRCVDPYWEGIGTAGSGLQTLRTLAALSILAEATDQLWNADTASVSVPIRAAA